MKRIVSFVALMLAVTTLSAQERPVLRAVTPSDSTAPLQRRATLRLSQKPAGSHYTLGIVIDGDTIPYFKLPEITVYASGMLLTQAEIRNNKKLIRNIRMMLPYAKEGKRRLDKLEVEIAALPKKQRKAAIKQAEEELLRDYKGEISNYTFSQGLVLIKLIDRETSRTAYNIVGELRGSLRAGLYQTLAKLFGYNLKTTFDPKNDPKDNLIDRIVISIERGQL